MKRLTRWTHEGAQLNTAKEILAYELTKLVHGEEEAKKAQESARALFSGGNAANMPTAVITEENLRDGEIDIMGLLVASGLCASRSEARRAVQQGGVAVNGEKVGSIELLTNRKTSIKRTLYYAVVKRTIVKLFLSKI